MSPKMKKFLSYYKPYLRLFAADMLFAFLAAAISLVYPLIVRYITNTLLVEYGVEAAMRQIILLCLVMVGLALLNLGCQFFITHKGHMMGAYMERDMRNDIFNHFQKLSFTFYDNQKVGQLMSRITNDLFDITELCHHGPEDIVISLIKFVGAFVILIRINAPLTLLVFAVLPFMVVFALSVRKKMNKAFRRNRERIADINAQIEDNLSGIRVVKSFANEPLEMEKFKEGNGRFVASKNKSYFWMATFHSGLGFFTNILNVVVIVGGTYLILKKIILVTDLLTFLLYINNLIEPVRTLINFTEQFQNGITGFERFYEILAVQPDIADRKGAKPLGDVRGDVTFEHVAFRYKDTREDVFRGIDLDVRAGDYIALVGSSGVGKTTMCSLIPRFYDVAEGAVKIDGVDVRDIALRSLRKNIGIVQQDVYLFAGTVMDNIRYGNMEATDEAIIEAAKNANAHDFIMELPDGYGTDIGQRGVKLSGGQKQRLSIARVFLKNPPILIFDEATSALDNESERVVQESLERLAKNRTTFVIAHRLTTIRNAKDIIVLTENGIAERGTHEALLARGGIYSGLYRMAEKK